MVVFMYANYIAGDKMSTKRKIAKGYFPQAKVEAKAKLEENLISGILNLNLSLNLK